MRKRSHSRGPYHSRFLTACEQEGNESDAGNETAEMSATVDEDFIDYLDVYDDRSVCISRRVWTHKMWNQGVRSLRRCQSLPTTIPLENIQVRKSELWVKSKDLIIRQTNTNDIRCVFWILRNIADPEALNAAIRPAGVARWFDDGTDVNLPTSEERFDPTRTLYPGSRDRAYCSSSVEVVEWSGSARLSSR